MQLQSSLRNMLIRRQIFLPEQVSRKRVKKSTTVERKLGQLRKRFAELLPQGNKLTQDGGQLQLQSESRGSGSLPMQDNLTPLTRDIASKTLRITAMHTPSGNEGTEINSNWTVTLPLFPDTTGNLTTALDIDGILRGDRDIPVSEINCSNQEEVSIACTDYFNGNQQVFYFKCDSSLAGSTIEILCPQTLIVPVLLRSGNTVPQEWSDEPHSINFDGRHVSANTTKTGLFTSTLFTTNTGVAGRVKSTESSSSADSANAGSTGQVSGGAVAGIVIGLIAAATIIGIVVHFRRKTSDVSRPTPETPSNATWDVYFGTHDEAQPSRTAKH
eukprot:gb/GECG01000216.1/.p1 GENE.gb/GECG01000216.1/~~gb/GECG01000216.1/.p1  ORF type:complete len:329 (+),score=42.98 gb/GECG01000216.1/:1-987(+)